jgi:hypothetical protein
MFGILISGVKGRNNLQAGRVAGEGLTPAATVVVHTTCKKGSRYAGGRNDKVLRCLVAFSGLLSEAGKEN